MPWMPTSILDASATGPASVPVEVAGVAVLLVRAGAAWYAIEDRCSHAGCAFSTDGELDGVVMICDCHGSEFDVRTGAVVRPPAERPIATYPVRSIDGALEVEL